MDQGQVVESNPVTTEAAPTGQADVSVGTPEGQNGQASTQGQSAPAEESFSNIDPKTLSPELQAVYKNLQADYTKKTQSIAESKKKAEAFDQIRSRSDFNDWWNGTSRQQKAEFKEQKAEVEKTLGQKISDEDFVKGFQNKDNFLSLLEKVARETTSKSQKEIETLKQQLSVKDAGDVVESFATQIDKKTGQLVRPDFYALDEDQLITGFLTINQPKQGDAGSYQQKLNEAYNWAKAVTTKYYEKGRQEALARIQQKASSSTEMPTNALKTSWPGGDPKKMSVKELMDYAKRGIKVPRDD